MENEVGIRRDFYKKNALEKIDEALKSTTILKSLCFKEQISNIVVCFLLCTRPVKFPNIVKKGGNLI